MFSTCLNIKFTSICAYCQFMTYPPKLFMPLCIKMSNRHVKGYLQFYLGVAHVVSISIGVAGNRKGRYST